MLVKIIILRGIFGALVWASIAAFWGWWGLTWHFLLLTVPAWFLCIWWFRHDFLEIFYYMYASWIVFRESMTNLPADEYLDKPFREVFFEIMRQQRLRRIELVEEMKGSRK